MSPAIRARLVVVVVAAMSLATAVAGGLGRLGAIHAPAVAISHHAVLMIGGFLGTVISLERAVALAHPAGFAAPALSALGVVLLLAGAPVAASAAWIAAGACLVAASIAIVRRQPVLHTSLLAIAAGAWLAGNVAFATGAYAGVIEAWLGFLVLTVAAERLDLTRLLPRKPFALASFRVVAALLLAAIAACFVDATAGGIAFGAALVALGAWLWRYDVARRTVRATGFARFAAVSLLAGYAWLGVGGAAWIAMAAGQGAARDLALHAIALGFVFSMILGHAPVVVPAIARTRIRFHAGFYAPLVLLHASLLVRALAPYGSWRAAAGVGNAVAIALFAAMIVISLRAGREGGGRRAPRKADEHGAIMEEHNLAG